MSLAEALRDARTAGRPSVVPYVLVDRARRARLRATVAALRAGGATALELGFPFSDPIADGPVLASAAGEALRHGTDWSDLLAACRETRGILPTAVMTYANPVLSHGLRPALAELAAAGMSGLIVPDLSLEESAPWRRVARQLGVELVLLAAPGVSPDRLARIARASRGFLYLVGHYGTTGATRAGTEFDLRPLVTAAHRAAPELPVLVGFGVRDRASAQRVLAKGADGVVVGSALEELLARAPPASRVRRWIAAIASARRPRAPPRPRARA